MIAADPLVVGVFGERWRAADRTAPDPRGARPVEDPGRDHGAGVPGRRGRPQLNYQIGLWHAAVLFGTIYALAPPYGIRGVAWAEVCASIASMLPCFFFASRILQLPLRNLAANVVKPCGSAALVAIVLLGAKTAVIHLPETAELVVLLVVGAAAYVATMLTFGRAELRTVVGTFRTRPTVESQ